MNTVQLLSALPATNVTVGGVFPADKIPWKWSRPCAIIANTDDSNQPGSHWVAMYADQEGNGTYFDSYGVPPRDCRFTRCFRRNCRSYKYNHTQLQSYTTSVCGHYCVVVLHWLSSGLSLLSFLQKFSNDRQRNDKLIVRMFNKIIKNYSKSRFKKKFVNLTGKGSIIQTCNNGNNKHTYVL